MTNIQWFPGHMAKARREANEKIKLVDIVIELVDARIPESSRNPVISEIIKQKPTILVLNKADLADSKLTTKWLADYHSQGKAAVAIDAQHTKGLSELQKVCRQLMAPYFEKQAAKGVKPRAIRLMVLGIPNVGKSTLINRFVGKNQAITGNKPGVTKAQRWLKLGKEFELLDTPGILWPKFEDTDVGKKLAITGAIKDQLIHMDDLAIYLLDYLRQHQPQILVEKFKSVTEESLGQLTTIALLLQITRDLGLKDQYDEASSRLIQLYRTGSFGPITLDLPVESIGI